MSIDRLKWTRHYGTAVAPKWRYIQTLFRVNKEVDKWNSLQCYFTGVKIDQILLIFFAAIRILQLCPLFTRPNSTERMIYTRFLYIALLNNKWWENRQFFIFIIFAIDGNLCYVNAKRKIEIPRIVASQFLFRAFNGSEKNQMTSNYPSENTIHLHCMPKMQKGIVEIEHNWKVVRSTCSSLNGERVWHFFPVYHYFNKPIPIAFAIYNSTKFYFCLCRFPQLRNLSQRSHHFQINMLYVLSVEMTTFAAATMTTTTL